MTAVFADALYFVARLNRHDQHRDRLLTTALERDGQEMRSDGQAGGSGILILLPC